MAKFKTFRPLVLPLIDRKRGAYMRGYYAGLPSHAEIKNGEGAIDTPPPCIMNSYRAYNKGTRKR